MCHRIVADTHEMPQNQQCTGVQGALLCQGGTERDGQSCNTVADCGKVGKGDINPDYLLSPCMMTSAVALEQAPARSSARWATLQVFRV